MISGLLDLPASSGLLATQDLPAIQDIKGPLVILDLPAPSGLLATPDLPAILDQ